MRASSISHMLPTCFRIQLLGFLAVTFPSLAPAQTPEPLAHFSVRATDLVGNEISSVLVGEQFRLDVFVQDVRNPIDAPFPGVFAGAVKINFDDSLTPVHLPPDFEIDSFFPIVRLFDVDPDAIYVSGASVSLNNPGNDPQRLLSVVLEAAGPGTQVFTPSFFQTSDFLTLLYGGPDIDGVPAERIHYQSATLAVLVPEPSSWAIGLSAAIAAWPIVRRRRSIRRAGESSPRVGHARVVARLASVLTLVLCVFSATIAAAQPSDPIALYYTRTTNLAGDPISSITVGELFKLDVIVQDIREPELSHSGVFAAATKVLYDESLTPIAVPLDVEFGPDFDFNHPAVQNVVVESDAIIGYAQRASFSAPGNDPQVVFNIVLVASNPGTQTFTPTFFADLDIVTVVFGETIGVPDVRLLYQGSTLAVLVPEPSSCALGLMAIVGAWPLWRSRRKRK